MKKYNNIIFDLGGVILNIDYHKTINELQKLTKIDVSAYYSQHSQDDLFSRYETGKITTTEFRDSMRTQLELEGTDEQIDYAWCALLLDLPQERINFIQDISQSHRIFLFSNTCEMHKNKFDKKIKLENNIDSLDNLFERAYYSHILGLRKPSEESFKYILQENSLEPSETLFIDDSIGHIKGAQAVGIKTYHLVPSLDVTTIGLT